MSDEKVIRLIPEHPSPFGGKLGRHVEHDPKSRAFGFGAIADAASLRAVHHRRFGPVFDQGQLGSCTGNAAAGAVNTIPFHAPHRQLSEQDAVEVYELATQLDDIDGTYPPEDTGSSGLAAAQALRQKSYISAFQHAFSVEEALTALQTVPVITGVNWYEGFDQPDDRGRVEIAGEVRGGHEFEVVGFEPHAKLDESRVVCINSWGTGWGWTGRFAFTVATWRRLLDEQGDVTILVK